MPTEKQRINISVSNSLHKVVAALADRDEVPVATKVRDLLFQGLELEEDFYFAHLAEERLKRKDRRLLTHDEVWQ